jgi:polysaccharide biosynthesis transport protein
MDAHKDQHQAKDCKPGDLAPAVPEVATIVPRRMIPVMVPSAAPAGLSTTPDAMSLLKALRRRWFLAGALGCLAAVVTAAVAWYVLPPKFVATATLMVSAQNQMGPERMANPQDHLRMLRTSADRLKGKDVLLRTLNQDGIRNLRIIRKHPDAISALAWMEENLKVEFKENSELITINLSGEDADDLRAVLGALTKSFLDTVNKEDKKQKNDRLQSFERMHVEAKTKLQEKLGEKEALVKLNGNKPVQTMLAEQVANRHRLDRAQEILGQHQFDLDKKNTRIAVLQSHKAKLKDLPPPEFSRKDLNELEPTGKLKQLAERLTIVEKIVDRLRKNGQPEDDAYMRLYLNELAETKKSVAKLAADTRVEAAAKLRKKQEADLDGAILELRTEITPLESYVGKYQKDVDNLAKLAEEINFWTSKLTVVETEIVSQDKAVAELFQAVGRATIEQNAEPRISQIGEAEWQPRDVKKRLLMLLFAPLLALCGAVLAVGWWEFSARRIQGADELETGLAMRVVGAVPELPDPRRVHSVANAEAQEIYRHNLIESIDAIRTMLLRNGPPDEIRTVMVTSAVGGEGKTTLASNLAMSLARAGRKTLLMDCDLRRPTAHHMFEQTLQPGFSEVALREVELPDALRPTTTDPNLYLLPAGHWDREVIQELAKDGITGIFEKLRQEFDFIIIDSHPVLPATDSLLIGQHVDAVIVSVMRDVSQMHHVHTACQQLSTLGIRVFGAVVNGVPVKVYGKGYQYAAQPAA